MLDYEYMGTVRLCTLRCTPDMYTRISIRTMALWRQLGADTMALADPCSTTGWIYITGLLDAADLVINWQLAYITGSSGYRWYYDAGPRPVRLAAPGTQCSRPE